MKTLFSVFLGVLLCMVILSVGVPAQDKFTKISGDGDVLNGKATSLPKPEYPEAARQGKISGVVAVHVTIDASGMVILAEADQYDQRHRLNEDGTKSEPVVVDAALREASEKAAYKAKFSPTLINHEPVQVKGTIVYNFASDTVTAGTVPKTLSGGVLNGKAISLPLPAYPPAARAVGAGGAVSVQILVDETGNVISASAVSGHPLLRSAAEAAAREAKFAPTQLSGQPVKVSGIVTYNFVLPKKDDQ